jgi:hypothetical protein
MWTFTTQRVSRHHIWIHIIFHIFPLLAILGNTNIANKRGHIIKDNMPADIENPVSVLFAVECNNPTVIIAPKIHIVNTNAGLPNIKSFIH